MPVLRWSSPACVISGIEKFALILSASKDEGFRLYQFAKAFVPTIAILCTPRRWASDSTSATVS